MRTWQIWCIRIVGIVSFLISICMLYLFICHKKTAGWDYALATDEVGQYGDFVGGFIGTILSIVLLYFTLTLQREDSANNSKIYQNQQLNDEFFHLLEVYNRILQSFSIDDEENHYIGKIALHKNVEDLYDGFDAKTPISIRRKFAVFAYQDFYMREHDFAPVYFRTLYRICEIIDGNKNCDMEKKLEYMKILRAQLTDSELILLRYNAMTPLGHNFVQYINKYNLLKHIPIFLLLEYKGWRQQLKNTNAVFKLSNILQSLKGKMSDMLKDNGNGNFEKSSSLGKYQVGISCNNEKTKITLTLTRKVNVTIQEWDDFSLLDSLSHNSLTGLLRYYMKDCFVLNSFNRLNKRKDLILNYNESATNGIESIEIWVENLASPRNKLKL